MGVKFWKVGVWVRPNGVMVSWLRLQTANSFRRHPTSISYVYKVFQHLDMLWMDSWVHPYTDTCAGRVSFWKVGVWVRANGVVVSWLRLQTASDCIPNPYNLYKVLKHLDMLLMDISVHPYTVTLV